MMFADGTCVHDDIVGAEYVESLRLNRLLARKKLFNNEDGIQPIPR